MKTIKVKDFNHFVDVQDDHVARVQRIGGDLDTLFNTNLQNAKEGEWRDIRSTFYFYFFYFFIFLISHSVLLTFVLG